MERLYRFTETSLTYTGPTKFETAAVGDSSRIYLSLIAVGAGATINLSTLANAVAANCFQITGGSKPVAEYTLREKDDPFLVEQPWFYKSSVIGSASLIRFEVFALPKEQAAGDNRFKGEAADIYPATDEPQGAETRGGYIRRILRDALRGLTHGS